MKAKIKRAFRLLKALATDTRVPRPVRWLIGVSLAIKAVPFPDFGIDEVGLLIAFVLLSTLHRETFNEIRAEIRRQDDVNSEDNSELDHLADPSPAVDPHRPADDDTDQVMPMTTTVVSGRAPDSPPASSP
jgi:hypothetical protein